MRAARFFKWGMKPLHGLALILATVVGVNYSWYAGAGVCVATLSAYYLAANATARCPRCGQAWSWEETETYVCSRCRIDIGFAFREK